MSRRPSGMPTHLAEHTGHLVSVANQSSAQSPQRWWPHAVTREGLFVESAAPPRRRGEMLFLDMGESCAKGRRPWGGGRGAGDGRGEAGGYGR